MFLCNTAKSTLLYVWLIRSLFFHYTFFALHYWAQCNHIYWSQIFVESLQKPETASWFGSCYSATWLRCFSNIILYHEAHFRRICRLSVGVCVTLFPVPPFNRFPSTNKKHCARSQKQSALKQWFLIGGVTPRQGASINYPGTRAFTCSTTLKVFKRKNATSNLVVWSKTCLKTKDFYSSEAWYRKG